MTPKAKQRETEVLLSIRRLKTARKTPPTIRELAAELGRSVGGVHRDLYSLRDQGKITWEDNRSRTLRILPRERAKTSA